MIVERACMFKDKKEHKEHKESENETHLDLAAPQEAACEPASQEEKKTPVPGDKVVPIKEAEYKKLLAELSDTRDKYLRLLAEFENVRKRSEREKIEFVKYANEELLSQFLNVLDDLERSVEAAKANHQDYSAFLKGIEMVMAHIYEMLKKNNVKPIEAVGKKFDPHCHEALMQGETNEFEDDVVMEEFQKGYKYGDRVVRTAKVKVAKRKEQTNETKD